MIYTILVIIIILLTIHNSILRNKTYNKLKKENKYEKKLLKKQKRIHCLENRVLYYKKKSKNDMI